MPLKLPRIAAVVIAACLLIAGIYYLVSLNNHYTNALASADSQIASLKSTISELTNEDQRVKNASLSATINQIKATYKHSVSVYNSLTDLTILSKNTAKLTTSYAQAISFLAAENYSSASAQLVQLNLDIAAEKQKATAALIPTNIPIPVNNAPPGSGYARQTVTTDVGNFVVSLISADLGSTKVIVDTASDSDCGNNCPVLPLAVYVSRNGAYAGVNGSYFCPASYPTCAGKTNTFDLLVMNKNKHYFNSDNNVYSANPAVIFGGSYVRFVSQSSQWGRDTGIDSMLSNYPLTVQGNSISFAGNADPKQVSKSNRSFVANKGTTIYIGVAHNVTVVESAHVLKALGMDNALNLDSGGSTALWSNGYKVGPGRDLPNVILFVKK